jgi:hypothetical protein
MKDSIKSSFAHTINSLSGMPPMSECYNYGMTWGCDLDCPVLARHECELKDAENKELYQEFLTSNPK